MAGWGDRSVRRTLLMLPTVLVLHWPPTVLAEAVENAYLVCDIFEKTGISTQCEVSNVLSSVDAVVDTNQAEAARICSLITATMVQKKRFFGGRWKLQIFAPANAAQPLAVCPLR
jgi:hypothetical protein